MATLVGYTAPLGLYNNLIQYNPEPFTGRCFRKGLLVIATRKRIELFNRPRNPNRFLTYRSLHIPFNALSGEVTASTREAV